ncbi:hypothetical protein LWF15_02525 [Kineosporia rhizophila]|uniref:hypothetical protein n=1 Tax=Kineosporia rhizophila TaxID=84633 RepID=UPI001E52B2BD|nr:hypothetical protein [Kineosporia rhizophila]MCE0534374.1 hypothetical protein [Kineosporia rhizophila]
MELVTPPNDAAWMKKSADLLEDLKAATSAEERAKIIDANSSVWGSLKTWLLAASHGKCWFSEAKDCFSHWDVEHFRPKTSAKDRDGTIVEGYWWLAFDWTNFRICGNVGNRKKGTFFPVRPGTNRVKLGGDQRQEEYLLLDPSDPEDPSLLFFNMAGEAIPGPFVRDDWERLRVTYSVERYKLDYEPLVQKRKAIWFECNNTINEYLRELDEYTQDKTKIIARHQVKEAAKRLRRMVDVREELSSVARACIISRSDMRLAGFL